MRKILLSVLLLSANICFAQVDLNLGLKAYYPFSGNANDVSGNNNNPVFNNATLTADRFGNPNSAYHFDGSSSYMRILNSATLNTSNKLSLVAWVKPQGFYAGTCHGNAIIMKGDADNLTGNYLMRYDDNVYTNGNNCFQSVDVLHQNFYGLGVQTLSPGYTPYIQTNQWYSVIVTYDGTTAKLYVNCELKASAPQGSATFTNAYDLYIGRLNSGSFPYWVTGDIDEVRIYDRALNVDEVNTLGGCVVPTACNNWLSTPGNPSYASIGDLDVSGNQLTIEATYNRTQPLNSGIYPGHLVSKHTNASDDNYSLFPNGCGLTTSNGYKETFETCGLLLNKTYHVAMVYNGSSLKFYRNGFLMSQVACTGNLIVNNLSATIAQYAGSNGPDQQFLGNVNEVRIWNVARSQAQLQTYMNSSLPNPTTIPGLLGYYTFDNLLNKQGNAAFNATLNGAAAINATNPNCTFVADSCAVPVSCNNWLITPTNPSTVSIGNLNVTGNQITVETNFNCTSYTSSGLGFGGKLIGKHTNAANTCYALSPHAAELSTSNNGYVVTYDNCPFELNKTYHVAMVYDGTALKFYRNGFLMSQVPCSGNISTNSLLASIGNGPNSPLITQFFGYINEMRIWNVARTQAQIRTYMNSSLPNPATQPGLLAYYTFDNLVNKQGNTTFNGTLTGGATINNINPNCTFTADSCAVTAGISNIINTYTPVTGFNICDNKLTVEDASTFNTGDTVLLIQMKGAVIDSSNTAAFGTITDYKNAGNYEFNYVKSKAGNIIELKNFVTRQYDIPTGKVQLVRVPYYTSVNVSGTLTCLPWDGSKGGVLVFNARDTISLGADIDVSGNGLRGGISSNITVNTLMCNNSNYYYDSAATISARKGEGIAAIGSTKLNGKGRSGNGGGGGNGHNAGGGGGSNASSGGFGGYQLDNCGGAPFDNRGVGGQALSYNNTLNKVFLGGGGGAGHYDGVFGTGRYSNGGNGGGIVLINAGTLISNNHTISAKGVTGEDCIQAGFPCNHDGMAGGGAGGSVLLGINTFVDNNIQNVSGGKGANLEVYNAAAGKVGPGGGGSGGVVWFKSGSLPANSTVQNTGGANGVIVPAGNDPWGAAPGSTGVSLFNLVVPVDNTPFKKNIDSVRIKDSILVCTNFDFKGLAYTNTSAVNSWQWSFGDGGTATSQNTTHNYISSGTYTVKLIVTDINGCRDSISKNVTTAPFIVDAGRDTSICTANAVSIKLNASAGVTYAWTPAAFLNNPAIQGPTATISATTRFYVTITNALGCVGTDSVTISIAPPVPNLRYQTLNAFASQPVQLQARNLGGNSYVWLPATGLNNNLIINPIFSYNQSQEYKINITTAAGCKVTDTLLIVVKGKKGIYVPKAFSPNGDGTNDRLYPILVGIRVLNYFRVYNRWGNLVFETNSDNPAAGWNGKINGNEQPPETYTWTAEGIDIDGIVIKKSGNTFLVR